MTVSSRPHIKCYLSQEKSSHEGSGGGFTVVRFFHLVVVNDSPFLLHRVKAHYRLMKGDECFQEDDLCVEGIAPGATVRSETFIRDSAVFDRIEWVGDISVEADQVIPRNWIAFKKSTSHLLNPWHFISLLLLIVAAALAYLFVFRG